MSEKKIMTKEEIIDHWKALDENQELAMAPIPADISARRYVHDAITLTGSKEFIDSILSRIKDLMDYESETSNLHLVYMERKDKIDGNELDRSWIFCLSAQEKGR